jgi:spermidine synthase
MGSGDRTIARRASVNWIMLIYFASGACSLIDEVVWVRLLKLVLGNTVYATSIVVSVFMGGLALGALIMSRYSDRIRGRLRLYALLEACVTVSALALPWMLKLADHIYIWLYRAYHPAHGALLVVQIVISAAILLVPTMLMGSTLPLLGRFVTALEKEAGHLVGRLYALNTLGAAAGCFLAGFVLIRSLGVMGTLYAAAGLNLLVAFGGWFLSKFSRAAAEETPEAVKVERPAVSAEEAASGRFYLLVAAFFMSGLISIGYELLWMRSIIHLLSGYTYVFSAVLTIYLLGNVIGAGIGSGLARRLKRPALGFAVTLSFLGLCGVFYLPVLILWTSKVLPHVNRAVESSSEYIAFSAHMLKPLVQSAFLFLTPAIVMGVGFPIALQAWANHVHKVGRSTGTAYGANTIGAVLGGIVTGFVLIPLLGLQAAITALGVAAIWIAGIMCLAFARASRLAVRVAVLAGAAVLTAVAWEVPSDLFKMVVEMNPLLPKNLMLLSVEEGVTATVSVHRDPADDALWLVVSGGGVAGDTYFWRGDQQMLGHFGVLLGRNVRKTLSVGYGSGESMACLALHNLEQVDCVEIAPEVVRLSSKFFRHINLGDRLDEEVNMIYMDAKNYIRLTDTTYDAIISDVTSTRRFAENASLYTKEYFESAKEHLSSHGLFMTWMPTHIHEPAVIIKSIIGTMMDVFPHVTLWYMTPVPAPYFLIVGSEQPQRFSVRHIERALSRAGVRDSLSQVNINNSADVLSCYVGDQNDLSPWVTSFVINSDDRPFLEFCTESKPGGVVEHMQFVLGARSDSVYSHIDWTGWSEAEKNAWLSDFKQVYAGALYLLMSGGTDNYLEKLKYSMGGLRILPGNPALVHLRSRVEKEILAVCKDKIFSGKITEALSMASEVERLHPESAVVWLIRSIAMQETGDLQRAFDSARMAVHCEPDSADAHFRLATMLLPAGHGTEAIRQYKEALRLAGQYREFSSYNPGQMLNAMATAYDSMGALDEAVAAAEEAFKYALSTGRKEMAQDVGRYLLALKAKERKRQLLGGQS